MPIRRALDWRTAQGAARRWGKQRNSLLVLTYHRVLPRGFPELPIVEPGMFVFDNTFEMHVRELLEHFQPVDLAVWLRLREQGGELPVRAFAITFDDGWRDNYDYAFPILTKLQVPATIFVVSALAGTQYSFWPERLARRLQSSIANTNIRSPWLDHLIRDSGVQLGALDNDAISRVISVAKRETDRANHAHLDELNKLFGAVDTNSSRDLADWSELAEMARSGLVRIGSHTRHHVRMSDQLSEDELRTEIVMSREEIEGNCGHSAELFCFPNGDMTVASVDLVEKTYRGACTTEIGWNTSTTPAHALRRVLIHEDRCSTKNAFLACLVSKL